MNESSGSAAWQRKMMDADPNTCWCFVAPDRVCIQQRPCPTHERVPDPVALAEAAWSLCVSQQAARVGWSMSKVGYMDRLRDVVEPFLVRDGEGDVVGFRGPSANRDSSEVSS